MDVIQLYKQAKNYLANYEEIQEANQAKIAYLKGARESDRAAFFHGNIDSEPEVTVRHMMFARIAESLANQEEQKKRMLITGKGFWELNKLDDWKITLEEALEKDKGMKNGWGGFNVSLVFNHIPTASMMPLIKHYQKLTESENSPYADKAYRSVSSLKRAVAPPTKGHGSA